VSPTEGTSYTEEQSRQAAEWFVIIHDASDPSAETLQAWSRWLAAAPAHRAAFEAVAQAYHLATPSLTAPLTAGPKSEQGSDEACGDDEYDGSVSVTEWLARAKDRTAPMRQGAAILGSAFLSRTWSSGLALAASVAILAVGWLVWRGYAQIGAAPNTSFATRTAEHMDLHLPDGSRVVLGARSQLRIDYSSARRGVWLDHGEAFFSVKKDRDRPFVVHALDDVITAVGTAFNVRATEDRLTVAVTEGAVRVSDNLTRQRAGAAAQESPGQGVRLSLGEQVSFVPRVRTPSREGVAISHFDPEEAIRWRAGWLIYRNEPLRYVIADVARYTTLTISVQDNVADELRFTGAVFKDNVDEWIAALPKVFPLAIRTSGAGVTIGANATTPLREQDRPEK
jgi:transmembrane sensor